MERSTMVKEKYYLVDYENVGCQSLELNQLLTKNDHIVLFYTENCKKIDLDILQGLNQTNLTVQKVPVGKQSTDMHIITYVGYLVGKHEQDSVEVIIISKDTDYDKVIHFWKDKVSLKRQERLDTTIQQSKSKPKVDGKKKSSMNNEIIKVLSSNKIANKQTGLIAKIVSKYYGKEHFERDVHNELNKTYSNTKEIYSMIKPVLSKYC